MSQQGGQQQLPQQRILVVEDEANIAAFVSMALRYEGFAVETAADGRSALGAVDRFAPHLIVLDVMLPDLDGFEVQRRLAAAGENRPVLFLTARDGVEDRVRGLTLGGDDYLTKPFALEELIARIRAILRRTGSEADTRQVLAFADLELDEDAHEVRRAGRLIHLTPTEFSLLRYLMLNARRVRSKQQILDHVWHYDFGGDGRIVEFYIGALRRKIDAEAPALIYTVRGVGYTMRLPES